MADNRLTNFEEKIIRLAISRYRRPFYRWGHLLPWLILPLLTLAISPRFKAHGVLITTIVSFVVLAWYFTVSTRVIGKLAARTAGDHLGEVTPNNDPWSPRRIPFAKSILAFIVLIPIAAIIAFGRSSGPVNSLSFAENVIAVEFTLCYFAGMAAIIASFVVYFYMENKPLSSNLMAWGMELVCWITVVILVYGAFHH